MTATGTSGEYSVTLTIRSDSGTANADSRSIGLLLGNGREINYAATAGISDADLLIALTALAVSLAAQERIAADLAGARFIGSVTTASGTHTATLGVLYCTPNPDGLTVAVAPVGTSDQQNYNVGTPAGADDVDAITTAANAQLQAAADALALQKANDADAAAGVIGATVTGTV